MSRRSLVFLGGNGQKAREDAQNALVSGYAYESLIALWREHGVTEEFLIEVQRNPMTAFFENCLELELTTLEGGVITWNYNSVADAINYCNRNVSAPLTGSLAPARNGIQFLKSNGEKVATGEQVARAWVRPDQCEAQSEFLVRALNAGYKIS